MISRGQQIFLAVFTIAFISVYLGLDTKPENRALVEKSRVLNAEAIDIRSEMDQAIGNIRSDERAYLNSLETQINPEIPDSSRAQIFEKLASRWYELGFPVISGYYAEEIAKLLEDNEEAWSIAGTTFALALKSELSEPRKEYSRKHAIEAFENAISINPGNIQHRINRALVYVEYPDQANPMKGITMLLDLDEKYPENVNVLNQLGLLAIKTGQYERARERFEKVLQLQENNQTAVCSLGKVYFQLGMNEKAQLFIDICNSLEN